MTSSSRMLLSFAILVIILAILIFFVVRSSNKRSATLPQTDESVAMVDAGLVQVESVNVELLESFPIQARAIATGLIVECAAVMTKPVVSYSDLDKSFVISLGSERPAGDYADMDCEAEPFTELIPLPIDGFAAGDYSVVVNGAQATFTLEIDNEVGFELDKG